MEYTLVRSKRKTVALQINAEGELIVRAPMLYSERKIKKLVEEHREWIENKKAESIERKRNHPELSKEEIAAYKKQAKDLLPALTKNSPQSWALNTEPLKLHPLKSVSALVAGKTIFAIPIFLCNILLKRLNMSLSMSWRTPFTMTTAERFMT